jgi:L-2-aminoadipate reductase
MPLNPNGKVDKPALPFPDTAQLAAASRQSRTDGEAQALSPTQQMVRDIWLSIIPHGPRNLELTDNFFDVGGHSILATRVVFEIRKRFAIELPLGILFRQPTIGGLSREIDILRGEDPDIAPRPANNITTDNTSNYLADAAALIMDLPKAYLSAQTTTKNSSVTVLLTGATGFLGAFLVRDLLSRKDVQIRVVAHVRADSITKGMQRLKTTCEAYGVWQDEWQTRLEIVTGSLELGYLGLSGEKWGELSNSVDVIIHNGAMVNPLPEVLMRLGTLGLSICSIARRQCFGNSDGIVPLQYREGEEICVHFIDFRP